MAAPLAILGTHTFAEEVADLVEQIGEHEVVAFVENWDRTRTNLTIAGRPVIWVDELAERDGDVRFSGRRRLLPVRWPGSSGRRRPPAASGVRPWR